MTSLKRAVMNGWRTPITERIGRYSAFIASFRFPDNANDNFRDLLKYYRISHNVTQRDMIACGAVNPDGSMTHGNSWDMAKELMRIVDERNAERRKASAKLKAKMDDAGWQYLGRSTWMKPLDDDPPVGGTQMTIATKHGKFTAAQVEDLYGFYCALREYRHAFGKLKMSIPE